MLAPGWVAAADEAKLLQPKIIRTSEAKRLSDKGQKALFVDVEERDSVSKTARIPGAINVPVEDVQGSGAKLCRGIGF